jgi:transposase
MMTPETPREALLLEQIAALAAENTALKQQIEQLTQDKRVLQLKVDAMARKLFGKSSEKLDPTQLQMVFDALDEEAKKPAASAGEDLAASEADSTQPEPPSPSSAKRKRRSLDDIISGLPVTEVIVDPEEVKADPDAWACIGAEETKLIDYTPGKFSCQKIVRRKYVRKEARHLPPITPPLSTLQDRCIATPRLLAHTATQRFELHLPYYRIQHSYARAGVPLSRQTLSGWMGMCADALRPLTMAARAEVFADGYVQADETPVKYQDAETPGSCGTGFFWVFYNPLRNICCFEWRTGRGAECLRDIVPADFKGVIQCDGHKAYETFIRLPGRAGVIILAGCLAHMRRKFFDAKEESEDAQWVLAQIQQLYRIENSLREARAGPDEVLSVRQRDSEPIMARIKQRLEQLQASQKHRPTTCTGAAISYSLNQWAKLRVFLDDGRVQIDNNLVENAIRPSAIGKKNWLFIGDAEAGHRAATFYTLIGNCHREGINAFAYLTDILTRLPRETNQTVHRLTPKGWAAERAAMHQALTQTAVAPL